MEQEGNETLTVVRRLLLGREKVLARMEGLLNDGRDLERDDRFLILQTPMILEMCRLGLEDGAAAGGWVDLEVRRLAVLWQRLTVVELRMGQREERARGDDGGR